jgi:hypothetical protein
MSSTRLVRAKLRLGLALFWPAAAFGAGPPPATTAAFDDAASAEPVVAEPKPAQPSEAAPAEPASSPSEPESPAAAPPATAPSPTSSALWFEKPDASGAAIPEVPPTIRPAKSWRVFGAVTYTAWGGSDFNGGGALFLPSPGSRVETTLIPALGAGTGVLLGVGMGGLPGEAGKGGVFLDLTYNATWLAPRSAFVEGSLGWAVFHQINLPFRLLYRARRFAPYFETSLGLGMVDVDRVRGVVDLHDQTFSSDQGAAHFSGLTFGTGFGALLFLSESLAVDVFAGGGLFVVSSYESVPLEATLTATHWTLRLGPALLL